MFDSNSEFTCGRQQEKDDSQDIEGLPVGDSHLLFPTQQRRAGGMGGLAELQHLALPLFGTHGCCNKTPVHLEEQRSKVTNVVYILSMCVRMLFTSST